MPYITMDYYIDEYKGINTNEPKALIRAIQRASDTIDGITNYSLVGKDLDKLNPFIKKQVELATSMLTEYYIANGGYESFIESGEANNVSIGSFNYSINSRSNNDSKNKSLEVPSSVINALSKTGLLYGGLSWG